MATAGAHLEQVHRLPKLGDEEEESAAPVAPPVPPTPSERQAKPKPDKAPEPEQFAPVVQSRRQRKRRRG
ncbi:hypothetical protein, partial [Vibrio parahaemolyticus]|uniref:hypothetical protein n=1 Tax=Vibrio parahaemolyticus TaxID=670 RepID=UPI00192D0D05